MKVSKQNHSGQVALIMVLIMTVIGAVAVSVASRSTVETRVQQMNVGNTEAILTAQAGLEEAILNNTGVTGSTGEGKQYAVTVDDTGTNQMISDIVSPGVTFEVNLEGSIGVTGVKVYWKPAAPGTLTSVFITDVRSSGDIDYAYDSVGENGFTKVNVGGSLGDVNYDYATPTPITISPANSSKIRITVLGAAAFLGVEPIGGVLPVQSTQYRSVADLSSDQISIKYGIEYTESKTNQLPSVFDYVLFSGGSIFQ